MDLCAEMQQNSSNHWHKGQARRFSRRFWLSPERTCWKRYSNIIVSSREIIYPQNLAHRSYLTSSKLIAWQGKYPPTFPYWGNWEHPAQGVHRVCAARAGASRAGTDPGLSHAGLAARAFLRHGSFVPGKQPIVATEAKMPIKAVLGATSASLANQDQHQELQGQRRETPTSPLTSVRVTSGYFKALQELRLSPEAAVIKTFPHCLKNSALPECGRKFFSPCSSALGHSGMLKQLC